MAEKHSNNHRLHYGTEKPQEEITWRSESHSQNDKYYAPADEIISLGKYRRLSGG